MFVFKSFLVIFLIFIYEVHSSKILCFFPTTSKSQLIIAQQLMVGLGEAGHETTLVSQFPLGRQVDNFREIIITPKTNVAGNYSCTTPDF